MENLEKEIKEYTTFIYEITASSVFSRSIVLNLLTIQPYMTRKDAERMMSQFPKLLAVHNSFVKTVEPYMEELLLVRTYVIGIETDMHFISETLKFNMKQQDNVVPKRVEEELESITNSMVHALGMLGGAMIKACEAIGKLIDVEEKQSSDKLGDAEMLSVMMSKNKYSA